MMEQRAHTARGRRVQLGDQRLPAGIGRWDEVGCDDAIEVRLKVAALQGRPLVSGAGRLLHDLVEQVARTGNLRATSGSRGRRLAPRRSRATGLDEAAP